MEVIPVGNIGIDGSAVSDGNIAAFYIDGRTGCLMVAEILVHSGIFDISPVIGGIDVECGA